jgi:hypothetical protein
MTHKFEEYPELSEMMQEYAAHGRFGDWQEFTDTLNNALTKAENLTLTDVVVPKGTFNCGQERAFGEERCKVQCKDCVIEYQDN